MILNYFTTCPHLTSITFRAGASFLFAFFYIFLLAPRFINSLKRFQAKGQPIRTFGPESHVKTKAGTPTMGGLIIIIAVGMAHLLFGRMSFASNGLLFLLVTFGAIGAMDDIKKLRKNSFHGIPARVKFLLQLAGAAAFLGIYYCYTPANMAGGISLPFMKAFLLNNTFLHFVFGVFVIVAFSNAVNLTDGLDGLASFPSLISFSTLGAIAYLSSHKGMAGYLEILHLAQAGEVTVFASAVAGALLGFLWYNALPAQMFMGDTGSLGLGAALGGTAILLKQEFLAAIIGAVFVAETVSVMLQVTYFKATGGKRIFLMTPIHHHFEKKGWSEATVVKRFWIISLICAVVGLLTLKVRF